MKLVFGLLERGLPSLHRGYRTPDPSPTRTGQGLPKCALEAIDTPRLDNMPCAMSGNCLLHC